MIEMVRAANFYETDAMGIVHHSNYVRWMEEFRVYYMKCHGVPFDEMIKRGISSPTLMINCEYKNPVRFGEAVKITARMTKYTGVRCVIEYEMRNAETGAICAVCKSEHCFTDSDGKIMILKHKAPDYDEIFKRVVKEENETETGE
ncbi:MAG: acyl-CoA thioesterase [Clostridiales bacterium]|nr:acyl-CoA thioesterase [Clostridiales bacterium]